MKGSRFSEEQIIGVLREVEAGLYKWKAKYGGMEVADARRLREFEEENRRLKKLLAEAMLDKPRSRDILKKNG